MFILSFVKSLCVLGALVLMVVLSLRLISSCKLPMWGMQRVMKYFFTGVVCICTIFAILFSANYLWPFDRNIEMTPYAVLEIPEERRREEPGGLEWTAIYGNESEITSRFGKPVSWPDSLELDLENYTYIVVHGREALSLKYNIWENVHFPYPIEDKAKAGKIEFSDEYDSSKIYVYRIKKMEIDHDICCS